MGEQWVNTKAGRHLAGRKKANTVPEVQLRRAIHAAGGRFRVQQQIVKGCTPDFVLPGRRIAVFVDGCFWHGCPRHGHKGPWKGPNARLWEAKMARNAANDARATQLAEARGWTVVRIWECEVMHDPASIAENLLHPIPARPAGPDPGER